MMEIDLLTQSSEDYDLSSKKQTSDRKSSPTIHKKVTMTQPHKKKPTHMRSSYKKRTKHLHDDSDSEEHFNDYLADKRIEKKR